MIDINNKLIVIVGPTGSGKTDLSIKLAKKYDAQIINADAFQVYKKMDIGTNKITAKEMQGIKHHLIDIVDYDFNYDVSTFQKQARSIIDKLLNEDKYVIVVGGSNLYVQALLYDYVFKGNDLEFENKKLELEDKTLKELQQIVEQYDVTLNNSEYNNKRRLVNIAAKLVLNIKIEEKQERNNYYNDFDLIGLYVKREVLYDNINNRVDIMIKNGLIDEVKQFDSKYYSQKAIGYKEIHEYLNNKMDLDTAINLIKQNSRNYAKRQLTWYKNKMDVDYYTVVNDKYKKIDV